MATSSERLNNQFLAWLKGKHVMLTIRNPDEKQTNKRFIRKPAVEVWGNPPNSRLHANTRGKKKRVEV